MSLRYETSHSLAGYKGGADVHFQLQLFFRVALHPRSHLFDAAAITSHSHLKPLHAVIMIDYTKAMPFVFVLAPIQHARYATSSGMAHIAACSPSAFAQSSPGSDTPYALLDDSPSSDDATSATNQDDTPSHTSSPSFSCGVVELFIILVGQIGFLAHQFLRISDVVDVLSSSFAILEQTTDLEMTNLCATMELVKQDVDSVKDQARCHEQILALEAREFATLVINQQHQIDDLSKQLHEERELSRDIKTNLDKLTSRVSRDDKELDVFHGHLHDQLACQIKDQELDAFHERLHGQLISQVKNQIRTENDVANLRKDIPKTLSLYHMRISALEFALSQALPPASPQDVACDSKPVRSATFVNANPLPERVLPNPQQLPTPRSAAPKKQRSGVPISARPLRFTDRESIYIQPPASVGSKAAGIPTKSTTPKTPTTVDSVRRPVTVKPSVSGVLQSSKIPTPGTKMSPVPKALLSKTSASKESSCDNRAPRESATLKKSGSATKGKVQEPRVHLKKSDSAVKDNAKVPKPLKKSSSAAKGKARELRNNQVLLPSSSQVTPATTSRAPDSTSRHDDALHGFASQPLSSSSSLEALDIAVQLHSLGDLRDPLPSLDSMSWLDVALDSVASQSLSSSSSLEALDTAVQRHSLGDLRDPLPSLDSMSWLDGALDTVASQPLSSSSSLEALDAAVQLHSLGDLRDPLPSLDSMSWLDECHEVAGQHRRPSSSMEALDAAVQLSSLDNLCGTMPSLDSMSFLDDDALTVPPFNSLGRNKARSIKFHRGLPRPSSSMKALDAAVQLSSLDDLCRMMPSLDSMSFFDDDALTVPPFKSLVRSKP
ncbi:hypothetical protein EDB19DRAFT_1948923 [Suillus lakei]|nr:hypothetical protein EDB19DRAFT_1948923 [Suillus lakei]